MDKFLEKAWQVSQLPWQMKDFLIATIINTVNPPLSLLAKQQHLKYVYESVEFCHSAFFLLFGIGEDWLQNIWEYSNQHGISIQIHGNMNQK